MKEYAQLSQKERRKIYIFFEMGLSKAQIAAKSSSGRSVLR